jgi:hypothetical protein
VTLVLSVVLVVDVHDAVETEGRAASVGVGLGRLAASPIPTSSFCPTLHTYKVLPPFAPYIKRLIEAN